MNRAVLVYPETGWAVKGVSISPPLSVLHLAGALKAAGIHCTVIDPRIQGDWRQRLTDAAREPGCQLVGISTMTGRQIHGGLAAAAAVREAAPDMPLVWGGVHPTLLPAQTARHPLVDVAVRGEGEEVLVDLVRALDAGDPLDGIEGLTFLRDGEIVTTPDRPRADPDTRAEPDLDLLPLSTYLRSTDSPMLDVLTSRGCPHLCGFCYNQSFYARSWRGESPDRVVRRLLDLERRYGVTAFNILDDDFFPSRKRVEAIADGLLDAGKRYALHVSCRIDYINRFPEEFWRKVRRAGIRQLMIGVESGSDEILRRIGKGVTRRDVMAANEKLAALGIRPKYSFMGGFPGESVAEIQDTLDLMRTLILSHPDARTTPLQVYTPYPGTPLWDELSPPAPEDLEGWADSRWTRAPAPWIDDRTRGLLERASYFSGLLDGRTVADFFAGRRPLWLALKVYGRILRARVRHGRYEAMPELGVLRVIERGGLGSGGDRH